MRHGVRGGEKEGTDIAAEVLHTSSREQGNLPRWAI